MGKKPAAASAPAKAAAPGERPPRPSHGHKWDEDKQQWVGKGSLDERKAQKLTDSGPRELADGTVLKSWQSLPSQLLLEWTQREKRAKPYYTHARSWDRDKYHQKVILTDAKNKDASLEFSPWDDSETLSAAREHAALLALLKVQGNLPLDRKLPEPYCDIWKSSTAAEKPEPKGKSKAKPKSDAKVASNSSVASATASSANSATAMAEEAEAGPSFAPPLRAASQYSSKAERDAAMRERNQERNKREAKRDMERRANMPAPILLSRKMRTLLYDVLGLQHAYESAGASADVEMDDTEAAAFTRCVEWGFSASDVMRALAVAKEEQSTVKVSDACVNQLAERLRQWLCLHLPEDELPEEFAAGRGQMSVHTGENAGAARSSAKVNVGAAPRTQSEEFQESQKSLLQWLGGELSSRLDASDADSLHASAEAVLLGVDLTSEDIDADEAGENVVLILSSENEELEALGRDFQERWKALWAARPSNEAADDGKVEVKEHSDGDDDDDDDDLTTTVGEDGSSAVAESVDGFFESGAPNDRDASKGSGRKGKKESGVWFGRDAGKQHLISAEASWPKSTSGQRMAQHRAGLPAAKSKDDLMRLSRENSVVLVQGETGCGKTTQVGQYILETDTAARVVVTQPRRVAATSVAHRVAEERGERLGDGSVGYSVRGESRLSRECCRLLFCTNGVLLRRLLGEPDSMFSEQTCTHLVIDEVHERSVEIDLLLTLLHYILPKRPNLRVLLMSATMDVAKLAAMFSKAPPTVKIPGRTFPVAQLFLDDVSDFLASHSSGKGQQGDNGSHLSQHDFKTIAELALGALRGQIREAPEDGAVLIFVPGVGEIDRVSKEIYHRIDKGEAYVLPLHGGLPPDQQRRCFEVPSKGGVRKIVVSTNVAETSVTVPDVTVVIDTGRERRLQLEAGAIAACLTESICARSSLTQRRGRAGRVRAGLCITMLTRRHYDKLPGEASPEIEAASLESLCLQVRVSGFEPFSFLSKMPTPPCTDRVSSAERLLAKIGATRSQDGEDHKEVTALGRHLAALPCDVHIGKLLVLGAFLGVASMALDVAAMLSVRSPLKSVARDQQAEAWRERLRQSLRPGGTKSDHCLYAKLLQLWAGATSAGRRELCQNAAVVWERMSEAASVRSQLANALRGLGFDVRSTDDQNAGEWRTLRVAVTGAFYPQVARVQRPAAEFAEGIGGAIAKQAEARKLRFFVQVDPTEVQDAIGLDSVTGSDNFIRSQNWRGRDQRGFLHPSSLLFKETSYSCPWLVFSSKQLQETKGDYSTKLNLSEASEASIYALLLFGGKLQIEHSDSQVTLDGWIRFSGGSTTVVELISRLRSEIDKLLLQKVEEPWLRLGDSPICQAVGTLVSTDGLG